MSDLPGRRSPRAGAPDPGIVEVRDTAPFAERLPVESAFPPIAELGFLSDCRTAALVGIDGTVEWLCPERFDGPAAFGRLLDRSAGAFRVAPSGRNVPTGRRYLPGTNVLETTWMTPGGWVVVIDALTIGTGSSSASGDQSADGMLIRTIECTRGEVPIDVSCAPLFDYGQTPGRWVRRGTDDEHVLEACDKTDALLWLSSDMPLSVVNDRARARQVLVEGDQRFCALSWVKGEGPRTFEQARARTQRTAHYWQSWLGRGNFPDHRHRTALERSALTIKGLCYAPTGAFIGAPTTSLPEVPGGADNWDHRLSRTRDVDALVRVLHRLGFDWEADDVIEQIVRSDRDADGAVQPMYRVDGTVAEGVQSLDHLTGYEGARPVRVGSEVLAGERRPANVSGAVVEALREHGFRTDQNPGRLWPIVQDQVNGAIKAWRMPDCGIWEVDAEPRHYVSSKLMSWVALDRGARLAARLGRDDLAEPWRVIADEIHNEIVEHGIDEQGRFASYYGARCIDAAGLLVPLTRFLPSDDARVRNTVMSIADELTESGHVVRYRSDEMDDPATDDRALVSCSFWLVRAYLAMGERRMARALYERLLSLASPLGLFAYSLDPWSGRHLGNFPHLSPHLALVEATLDMIRGEQDG